MDNVFDSAMDSGSAASAPFQSQNVVAGAAVSGSLSVSGVLSGPTVDQINTDVLNETSARIAADSAESAARQAADSTLQSNIDAEATSRSDADAALQSNIDVEEAARVAADSAESTARQAADSTLQSNIDAEATSRSDADAVLQSNIDSEEAARVAADSAGPRPARPRLHSAVQHRRRGHQPVGRRRSPAVQH